MNLRNIAIASALVLVALLLAIALSPQSADGSRQEKNASFKIIEVGRAGDYGFAIFSYSGDTKVMLLGYDSPPLKKITILNDSGGMSNERLSEFVNDLKPLEAYGFSVAVSDEKALGDGIFIIPSGAMPSYALDDLRYNATHAVIIYIGKDDLILEKGMKKEEWYSQLTPEQQARIVLFNSTPEDFLDSKSSLFSYILQNAWAARSNNSENFSGAGKQTAVVSLDGSEYMRVIYEAGGQKGVVDSSVMPAKGVGVYPKPDSIFPWEKSYVEFDLNKTNGTAYFGIWKEGSEISNDELGRVADGNYFAEILELKDPGNHIIRITDNSGTIGGGVVHVKDLRISYAGSSGVFYYFNITVDGKPLDNIKADVHLGNPNKTRTLYVSDGMLSVPADLQKGNNTFNFTLLGTSKAVYVEYSQESIADFYIKYGVPGMLIVIAVFFIARMSRRPIYMLRIGEGAGEIRKDVHMSPGIAIQVFGHVRKELGIGRWPLTAHEFALGIKQHVTDGADVTEGNVEDILQRLVKTGMLESYRQYYQPKGEGDARRNALSRMVRDKLIQAGLPFRMKSKVFLTERFQLGFLGDEFAGNAIVIVEDKHELDSIFGMANQKNLAQIRLKVANGTMQFLTIEQLEDAL